MKYKKMLSMNLQAYIILCITTAIWGGNSVAGKMAVGHVSPMTLTTSRWVIACLVLLVFAAPQVKRDMPAIAKNWLLLLGYGTVGFTAFNAFLYSALQYTSAINAVIEQAGIPMVIFLMNFALFRTAVSWAQIAGFTLTLFGVGLTASHGNPATLLSLQLNQGDALMMAAVLVYAGYTVALRWKPAIHWKSLIAVSAFGALLSSLPLLVWEIGQGNFIFPDTEGWMIVAYAGLLPSLVSQILYVRGVELIGPNRAGLFINTIPIFGMLLSILLIGETLETFHMIAMALVLVGIAVAERGRPKPAEAQAA
ncbi:drug/metabolite transporter (DMT)-like permease [Pararhizobium capsulatum DSM 1112]|uniref:Drug/metabolite transporter (DMT)-like permease n=2 Tax=Pararhizobium capsulatum TaxID=34014 RepID=A0ABU0BU14_9HYPH|nr:drug/metabolite transporter (DMT)-like permease [Pararhizobium capsulatum DSM 1112]